MPLGYEYKRYFIILQEEDKGYEMNAGKIPTGYVKIEIKKNRVKIGGFIQNMKSDTKSQYKLILLAPSKKLALDTGLFRMDGTGRGEFYAELDSDNVLSSNLSIDEFTGALVAAGSGIPLVGYTGRDSIQWRDWYGKKEEEKVEAKAREPEKDIHEIPNIQEKEEAEKIEDTREPEAIEETAEQEEVRIAEKIAKVVDEGKEDEIIDREEEREVRPITEPEIKLHYSFHGGDTDSLINEARRSEKDNKQSENKVNKKLINALRNMEIFDEFRDEYGLRWYRIGWELPLLNEVIIPINGAMMPLSYPYIAETSGRNIENCVLGVEHRKGEIRYVYIGIPAAYNEVCKSCLEYKGFTGYKRTRDKRIGYWIMCIDIIKGRICRV